MAAENGTGESGGNSSVWTQVRHGSESRPQQLAGAGLLAAPLTAADVDAAGLAGATAAGVGVIDRPGRGQVKLANGANHGRVEIHDSTELGDLGAPDHRNMFRVRLRIRRHEINEMIKADPNREGPLNAYWALLQQIAPALSAHTGGPPGIDAGVVSNDEIYLVVDVPAITRKPKGNEAWNDMPWEIYWQW